MKKCTQCGTIVSDNAKTGDRCPRCGLTWQFERNEPYTYAKQRKSSGCSWWVVLLIVALITAVILPIIIDSNDDSVSKKIAGQWLALNIDSINATKRKIMEFDSPKRLKIFNKACKEFARNIETVKGEEKIKLISLLTIIDSVFSSTSENLRLKNTDIYLMLLNFSGNQDLTSEIRSSADSSLLKLNLEK